MLCRIIKGETKMQIFTCKAYPELSIVATSYETRNSWGHKATLLHNNYNTLNTYKITYYNRTWETYQYQSVIKSVLNDYMDDIINEYINDYKLDNNITRLKKSIREELIKQCKETNTLYKKLNTFYGEL
jgi:hypothetical protein